MISRSKAERAAAVSPPAPAPEKKAAVPAKAIVLPAKAAVPAPDDMFEPTPITADTRATAQEIAAALAPRVDENIFEEQGAAPASRSRSEAKTQPVATIMGEDEIRLSGAATIPELLRRIPGIDPADIGTAEIRGLNRRGPAKVLVLVDGRSAVQELLGGTTWPLFDLPLSEVARVEVLRGSAPSVLGTISIATVVNVITKAGEDAAVARRAEEATAQGGVAAGGKTPK
jgi:iron complex outermembrane receptor protein